MCFSLLHLFLVLAQEEEVSEVILLSEEVSHRVQRAEDQPNQDHLEEAE